MLDNIYDTIISWLVGSVRPLTFHEAIQKLKDMETAGKVLNQEQLEKVAKEKEWNIELESVEHNLM